MSCETCVTALKKNPYYMGMCILNDFLELQVNLYCHNCESNSNLLLHKPTLTVGLCCKCNYSCNRAQYNFYKSSSILSTHLEPSGFRGRKGLLNRASALVTTCP